MRLKKLENKLYQELMEMTANKLLNKARQTSATVTALK